MEDPGDDKSRDQKRRRKKASRNDITLASNSVNKTKRSKVKNGKHKEAKVPSLGVRTGVPLSPSLSLPPLRREDTYTLINTKLVMTENTESGALRDTSHENDPYEIVVGYPIPFKGRSPFKRPFHIHSKVLLNEVLPGPEYVRNKNALLKAIELVVEFDDEGGEFYAQAYTDWRNSRFCHIVSPADDAHRIPRWDPTLLTANIKQSFRAYIINKDSGYIFQNACCDNIFCPVLEIFEIYIEYIAEWVSNRFCLYCGVFKRKNQPMRHYDTTKKGSYCSTRCKKKHSLTTDNSNSTRGLAYTGMK